MGELETIEGRVENRDPETEVLMKRSHGGRKKVYHEVHEGWEPGEFPPCGAHAKNANPHEYETLSLEAAIRKWAEPCQHYECTRIRNQKTAAEDYHNGDILFDLYWREKKTMSQVADKFDVDTDTISRWMRRNNVPRTKEGYRDKYEEEPPSKNYREISDEEREQVREEHDTFIICKGWRGEKIHLPGDEIALCTYPNRGAVEEVPVEEMESKDYCKQCVERWRK